MGKQYKYKCCTVTVVEHGTTEQGPTHWHVSCSFSHNMTRMWLSWGTSGHTNAAKIECAHIRASKLRTYYNQKIFTFSLFMITYFDLLKAFYTKTFNFHQYFEDKLSSHEPSHMHNTRHRTKSFLYSTLSSFKNLKMFFVPSNFYMEQPAKLA